LLKPTKINIPSVKMGGRNCDDSIFVVIFKCATGGSEQSTQQNE